MGPAGRQAANGPLAPARGAAGGPRELARPGVVFLQRTDSRRKVCPLFSFQEGSPLSGLQSARPHFSFSPFSFGSLEHPPPHPRYCKVGWSRGCRGECGRQVPGGRWESLGAEKRGYSRAQAAAAFRTLLFALFLSPPTPSPVRFGAAGFAASASQVSTGCTRREPRWAAADEGADPLPGSSPCRKGSEVLAGPKAHLGCLLSVCLCVCLLASRLTCKDLLRLHFMFRNVESKW